MKVLAWLFLGLFLVGCNTMEGLGKDVGNLGDSIEKKADEKKN